MHVLSTLLQQSMQAIPHELTERTRIVFRKLCRNVGEGTNKGIETFSSMMLKRHNVIAHTEPQIVCVYFIKKCWSADGKSALRSSLCVHWYVCGVCLCVLVCLNSFYPLPQALELLCRATAAM